MKLEDLLFFMSDQAFLTIVCEDQKQFYAGYFGDKEIYRCEEMYGSRPVIMFEMNELGFNIMIGGNTI